MVIKLINNENFNSNSLLAFDRHQVVKKVYRLVDGKLGLYDDCFEDDWSLERKREKAAEILSGEYITYGAFDGDRVVGLIMLVPKLNAGRLIVKSFHVSRDCRRRGIGRALFETAKAEARKRGAVALYISASSAEETMSFYLAMGCEISRKPIKEYAEDEPCDIQIECKL